MGCCYCKQAIDERSSAAKDPISGLGIIDHEETLAIDGDDDRQRQSKSWNRSLHRMALSVIDISSFETTNYDAKEYEERSQVYSSRLDESKLASTTCRKQSVKIRKPMDPKTLLIKGKISTEDVHLIDDTSEKSMNAVSGSFMVHSDQTVVQPFAPF